jgi:predicted Zn-dependent protease with MMP-like domain
VSERGGGGVWARRAADAEDEVRRTLRRLPAKLRRRAEALAVLCERRVRPDQLRDGIEPDTLGLFEGPSFGDEPQAEGVLPPRILLFIENLWAEADADEALFREEVRVTYLHELGHYLGLDEEALALRDLE